MITPKNIFYKLSLEGVYLGKNVRFAIDMVGLI
jgi:hypothetical protein